MAEVQTSMHFLKRDDLYEREKPFSLKYVAAEGIQTSNIQVEKHETIKVNSMRGQEQQYSLDTNGFTVLKMDEETPYDDFANPAGVQKYLGMVAEQLKNRLGADKVQVYQYVIRKRDPGFPIAKEGMEYKFTQPSTVAHIDATPEEAVNIFSQVNGDPAKASPNMRYQVVNVWKPLRGPLRDWPLALCDCRTVQPTDLTPADIVFDTKVSENMQVHFDEAQKWYYLEDQQPSELLVFRQAESPSVGRVGVPHTSFPNPNVGKDELPRESIEVRTLVSYGDVD